MMVRKAKKLPFTKPKTSKELRNTKRAIDIVRWVLQDIKPFGRTERDVAGEIRKRIYQYGAKPSFRPIVSTGRNTSLVHHRPGNRIIRRENPLMIDLGARFRGQCSDITRMHIPKGGRRLNRIYLDTLSIQGMIIRRLKPEIDFKELNEFCKKLLQKKGYRVKHSIGHGLGHSIHERIKELKPGMVLTVEPGIYLKEFGCRVEDMVLIKANRAEVLSDSIPKRL